MDLTFPLKTNNPHKSEALKALNLIRFKEKCKKNPTQVDAEFGEWDHHSWQTMVRYTLSTFYKIIYSEVLSASSDGSVKQRTAEKSQ